MAQNYASRPVTRIASGSAAASALAQISGLKSDVAPPTAQVLDHILGLPLLDLRGHLETATSDELRILRAYMGLGKAGTKEANKLLICEQVELRRSVLLSHPEPLELDDASFADGPVRELPAAPALPNFDKMQEDDPWTKYTIATPQTRRSTNVHSGLTPSLTEKFSKIGRILEHAE